MSARSDHRRRAGTVLLTLALLGTALVVVLRPAPAEATTRVMPGSFTGYAFDACQAPTQQEMDVWLERSPYWGVGIYIAGENRFCDVQDNLDADWVTQQSRRGWRLLPITVGRQASCSTTKRWLKIDPDPTDRYASARRQGRAEARSTARAADGLGIARRSTLWLDLESFDISRRRCRESALGFVSAWTARLHDLGFRSGLYSSASTGIRMVDRARVESPRAYHLPDQVWIGDWNGRQDTRSTYLPADAWAPHRRVHQYAGGHRETHGGVTLNVDSDFVDVGRGTVAPRPGPHCGVRREFGSYRVLHRGMRNAQVAALQCFLRQKRFTRAGVTGRYRPSTVRAVRRFQRAHELAVTGRVNRRVWMVLLAEGSTPLLKYGAGSDAVRRVQRALNAASSAGLEVTGVFERRTRAAVRDYQRSRGVHRTGVVTDDLWAMLQAGRR